MVAADHLLILEAADHLETVILEAIHKVVVHQEAAGLLQVEAEVEEAAEEADSF